MSVAIDRRPLSALLLHHSVPFAAVMVLAIVAWWMLGLEPAQGLTEPGWRALIVFALCLILWATQLFPLAVTSLLGLALIPLLGIMPAADSYSLFGNTAVFFILGALILAAGVIKTGLSEQLALGILKKVGGGTKRLLLAVLILSACMAFFMPEHAVAAIFLPIILEVVRGLDLPKGHRYSASLFFAMAWGTIIGGVATLLGGARGPLAIGILEEITGEQIAFLDWTIAAAPLVFCMLAVAIVVLLCCIRGVDVNTTGASERLRQRQLELGPLSSKGKWMAAVMLLTVAAWVFMGHAYGLASIALAAVVAMFFLRLVSWHDVEEYVNWGIVLMYGGAIAIGKALSVTGAAVWVANSMLPAGITSLALLAGLALITLLLTETVSNVAAVAILLPIAIPLGQAAGMDVVSITLAVAIVAGFAFMLPMGTPANALIYSTGYVRLHRMIRRGAVMSFSVWCLFLLTAWFIWPLIGRGW
ncbi:MAG: SLC13 family permease [Mariprofundaceae bacterium]